MADLCRSEEMPIASEAKDDASLPPSSLVLQTATNSKRKTLAVALPKMVGHSACVLQNQSLLFFGGMNRERYYSLSRLLSYNVAEDRFYWTLNDASRAPINANFNHTFPLQKYRATSFILIGGKLKEDVIQASISDHSTKKEESLLQYQAQELNLLRYWMEEEKQKKRPTFYSDREESQHKASPPTRLHKKKVTHTNHHTNKDIDDSKQKEVLAQQDCDPIHEFDASSLTWIRRSLHYYTGTPKTRNRTIFDSIMSDSQLALITELRKAFKKRVAQAFAPVYASDIPYRCPKCLFLDSTRASTCSCLTLKKASESQTSASETGEIVTWGIQFGGYCAQDDEIMNDTHVLFCRNQQHTHTVIK